MTDRDDILRGRARIAFEAGRSPATISTWVRRGILPVVKCGPFSNSPLECRAADLERVTRREGGD